MGNRMKGHIKDLFLLWCNLRYMGEGGTRQEWTQDPHVLGGCTVENKGETFQVSVLGPGSILSSFPKSSEVL